MMVRDTYLVFGQPVIDNDEINAVVETFKSKWVGTGPKVAEFETQFRNYVGATYSAALNSCTAGLHLAAESILPKGAKVITTPMTFAATANAIIHAGCTPVFCDVDPYTRNITAESIEEKITPKTHAILPVHFAGYPCKMHEIISLANKHNLSVIEDCAHAIETTINGKHAGTFGDVGCFSFYVTKNIMTVEGGMIITDNPEIEEKIKILSLHGMSKDAWKRFKDDGYKHYQVFYPGYKYNMTDIQAALGLVQLNKINSFRKRRKQIWDIYQQEFRKLACKLPPNDNDDQAYHLFCIEVIPEQLNKTRDQVLQEYHQLNIGTGVHYQALHLQPFYRKMFGFREGDFPNAEKIGATTISLPLTAGLSDNDIDYVVAATKQILKLK